MIPTVFQDVFISAFMAALFAWSGRNQLRFDTGLSRSPVFRRMLGFQLLVWTPAAAWFLWAHPSWSWWYLLPDSEAGLAWRILPLAVEFLTAVGAFVCMRELIRSGRTRAALAVLGAAAAATAFLLIAPTRYFGEVGTYEQFKAGQAVSLLSPSPFWIEMAIVSAAFYTGAFLVLRANLRQHRNPRLSPEDRPAWPPTPAAG